jgi:glycogen(starch) synthase
VILEAWAAGLPVVASEVGGVPSFVTDGMSGLLVPPNDLEAMVSSAELILDNTFARDTLSRGGNLKARRSFGWSQITDRLLDIYESVIRSHQGAPMSNSLVGKEVA